MIGILITYGGAALFLAIGIAIARVLRNAPKSGWVAAAMEFIPAGIVVSLQACQYG